MQSVGGQHTHQMEVQEKYNSSEKNTNLFGLWFGMYSWLPRCGVVNNLTNMPSQGGHYILTLTTEGLLKCWGAFPILWATGTQLSAAASEVAKPL